MLDKLPESVVLLVLQSIPARHTPGRFSPTFAIDVDDKDLYESDAASGGAPFPEAAKEGGAKDTPLGQWATRNQNLELAGRDLICVATTCKLVHDVLCKHEDDLFRKAYEVDFSYRSPAYARWKPIALAADGEKALKSATFCAWARCPLPWPLPAGQNSYKAAYVAQVMHKGFFKIIERAKDKQKRINGKPGLSMASPGPASPSSSVNSAALIKSLRSSSFEFRSVSEVKAVSIYENPFWSKPEAKFRLKFAYIIGRGAAYMEKIIREWAAALATERGRGQLPPPTSRCSGKESDKYLLRTLFVFECMLHEERNEERSPYTIFPWLESLIPEESFGMPLDVDGIKRIMTSLMEERTRKNQSVPMRPQSHFATFSFPSSYMERGAALPLVQNACLMYMLRCVGYQCSMTNTPGCVFVRIETREGEGPIFADADSFSVLTRAELETLLLGSDIIASVAPGTQLAPYIEGVPDQEMILRTGRNVFSTMERANVTGVSRSYVAPLILKLSSVVAETSRKLGLANIRANVDTPGVDRIIWDVYMYGVNRVLMP
ncbi:Hypothetical Protein FCC1311_107742 [Hondaea fermentalgiana]|uniref:Uncharacterized protein n=1 Tax=Hondaea fermentalgiana TaxID=2315210 RepID=A0A2R5GUM1_9STRA|nr:Hypothetical Protein FCC1311_107742 [Hondaea fermentalgiana]|eukprot:GBG34550.1 Hypothetical Protein FCC1311_107742 [Hondaea fermentalgiana]